MVQITIFDGWTHHHYPKLLWFVRALSLKFAMCLNVISVAKDLYCAILLSITIGFLVYFVHSLSLIHILILALALLSFSFVHTTKLDEQCVNKIISHYSIHIIIIWICTNWKEIVNIINGIKISFLNIRIACKILRKLHKHNTTYVYLVRKFLYVAERIYLCVYFAYK